EQVEMIQGAGAHSHEHLVGPDRGLRRVFVDQRLRPAMLMNPRDFHRPECSSPGARATPGAGHARMASVLLSAMRKLILFFATVLVLVQAQTAGKFALTIDNIMRGPGLVGYEPAQVRWSGDSRQIFFQWKQADQK